VLNEITEYVILAITQKICECADEDLCNCIRNLQPIQECACTFSVTSESFTNGTEILIDFNGSEHPVFVPCCPLELSATQTGDGPTIIQIDYNGESQTAEIPCCDFDLQTNRGTDGTEIEITYGGNTYTADVPCCDFDLETNAGTGATEIKITYGGNTYTADVPCPVLTGTAEFSATGTNLILEQCGTQVEVFIPNPSITLNYQHVGDNIGSTPIFLSVSGQSNKMEVTAFPIAITGTIVGLMGSLKSNCQGQEGNVKIPTGTDHNNSNVPEGEYVICMAVVVPYRTNNYGCPDLKSEDVKDYLSGNLKRTNNWEDPSDVYKPVWKVGCHALIINGLCASSNGERYNPYWDTTAPGIDQTHQDYDEYFHTEEKISATIHVNACDIMSFYVDPIGLTSLKVAGVTVLTAAAPGSV
jgi:hypothetical protein